MTEKLQFSTRSLLLLLLWASCGFFLFAIALQIAGICTNTQHRRKALAALALTFAFGVINTTLFLVWLFGHPEETLSATILLFVTPCVALAIIWIFGVAKPSWLNALSAIGAGIFVICCAMLCDLIYKSVAYAA